MHWMCVGPVGRGPGHYLQATGLQQDTPLCWSVTVSKGQLARRLRWPETADLSGRTGPGQQPLQSLLFLRGCQATPFAAAPAGPPGAGIVHRESVAGFGRCRLRCCQPPPYPDDWVYAKSVYASRMPLPGFHSLFAAATASSARPSLYRTTPRLSRADARLCPWMSGTIRASRGLRSTASWAATSASYTCLLCKGRIRACRGCGTRGGFAVARRWLAMLLSRPRRQCPGRRAERRAGDSDGL